MIDLIINPKSFRISKNKKLQQCQIFAEIYFQIEDKFFPGKSWDDFVVIILNWWIENILNIAGKNNEKSRCCFMDGPYFFDIESNDEYLSVCFVDDRFDNKKTVYCENILISCFMKILQKNANLILRLSSDFTAPVSEITELRNNYNRISKFIKSSRFAQKEKPKKGIQKEKEGQT